MVHTVCELLPTYLETEDALVDSEGMSVDSDESFPWMMASRQRGFP